MTVKQDSTVQLNDSNCLLINVSYLWLLFSKYIYEGEVERVTKKATSSNEGGMVHETVERSESKTTAINTFIEKDMGVVFDDEWLWNIAIYRGCKGLTTIFYFSVNR